MQGLGASSRVCQCGSAPTIGQARPKRLLSDIQYIPSLQYTGGPLVAQFFGREGFCKSQLQALSLSLSLSVSRTTLLIIGVSRSIPDMLGYARYQISGLDLPGVEKVSLCTFHLDRKRKWVRDMSVVLKASKRQ